jgi:hypothetical protein
MEAELDAQVARYMLLNQILSLLTNVIFFAIYSNMLVRWAVKTIGTKHELICSISMRKSSHADTYFKEIFFFQCPLRKLINTI